jgi:hypothetical protein
MKFLSLVRMNTFVPQPLGCKVFAKGHKISEIIHNLKNLTP